MTVYDEALPEMLARNITGTVFQVVGAVGGWNRWDVNLSLRPVRHLSWKQLRKLAEAGFEIGSHTLTHRDLTRLDDATLRRELHDSRKAIENEVGERVSSVSYPFGRYSRRVIDEARAAGYTCGFTSCPVSTSDPMVLGRWAVHSIDGTGALMRKLGLKAGTGLERFKSKAIAKLSLGTTLVRR
jgi:peptidoglycan/xylan/chitin deacetylase (PgdA/CDA1 family)